MIHDPGSALPSTEGVGAVLVMPICASCGSHDDVLSFDESDELWFCEECLDMDLTDPWLDLGEGG